MTLSRHGDRIQGSPGECWKGDTHTWDCLLADATTPTINRDQHYLRLERIYRKGSSEPCDLYQCVCQNENLMCI